MSEFVNNDYDDTGPPNDGATLDLRPFDDAGYDAPEYGIVDKVHLGIVKKVHDILKEVPYIQKDAHNEHFKFWYTSEGKVKATLLPLFQKHGLMPYWQPKNIRWESWGEKGGRMWYLDMHWKFIDTESGQFMAGVTPVQTYETGDKALSKCITFGIKITLTTQFIIPTGDDPDQTGFEADAHEPQRQNRGNPTKQAPKGNRPPAAQPSNDPSLTPQQQLARVASATHGKGNDGSNEAATHAYASLVKALKLTDTSRPTKDQLGVAIARKNSASSIRDLEFSVIIATINKIAEWGAKNGPAAAFTWIQEWSAKPDPNENGEEEAPPPSNDDDPGPQDGDEPGSEEESGEQEEQPEPEPEPEQIPEENRKPKPLMSFFAKLMPRLGEKTPLLNSYMEQNFGTRKLNEIKDQARAAAVLESMTKMGDSELLALLQTT